MAGNGKGLAAIALIIGIVGLAAGGYAAYDTFFGPEPEIPEQEPVPEINSYWYEENYYIPSTGGIENVTGQGITFNVTQNVSLYVSFNCYVYHAGSSMTEVRVYINDVVVSGYIRVYTATTTVTRTPLTIQHYDDVVENGTYTVNIKGSAAAGSTTVYYVPTMYIQTISLV